MYTLSSLKCSTATLNFLLQRIKFWFHNHTRGASSGAGTRGILKLGPSAKVVQPWQAYLNRFQHTKLKTEIDGAWEEYLKDIPEGEKPQKTQFEIRNKLAWNLYANETVAVKEEVKEHRKVMMSGKETSDAVERNQTFQRYDQCSITWNSQD